MIKNIEQLLSDEAAEKYAEEIVARFYEGQNDPEKEGIDYEYDLQDGQIVLEDNQYVKNTTYTFDPHPGSGLDTLIQSFIHDDVTRLPEIGDFEKMDAFLSEKVCKIIENKYAEKMKHAARRRVLGGASKEFFPMNGFRMLEISLHNFDKKYKVRVVRGIMVKKELLKNAKDAKEILPQKQRTKSVAEEIAEIHDLTGKSLEQIIAEKKALGDPEYTEVLGAQKIRAFYDCYIDMWFDYSINKKDK